MLRRLEATDGFIYTDGKGHYAEAVDTASASKWKLISKADSEYVTYLAREEKRKAKKEEEK